MIPFANKTVINLYVGEMILNKQELFEINLKLSFNCIKENYINGYSLPNSVLVNQQNTGRITMEGMNNVKFIEITEFVNLPNTNININEMKFFYFEEYLLLPNALAFGRKIYNRKHSLIMNLYDKNIINKECFTIIGSENKIYFGDIPLDTINFHYKNNISIISHDNYITWGFNIDRMLINNKQILFNKTYYLYFQANTDYIHIPVSIYNELLVLMNMKNKCEYNTNKIVTCNCNDIHLFPQIAFVFNDETFSLNNTDLFEKINHNTCTLKLRPNNNFDSYENSYEEMFIFGLLFLNKYPITFDYSTNSITLFYNTYKLSYITTFIKYTLILNIISTFYLIYVHIKIV
jgi:hypothetical protein